MAVGIGNGNTLQEYADSAINRGEHDLGEALGAFARIQEIDPQTPAQARAVLEAGAKALHALVVQHARAVNEGAELANRCQAPL